MVEINQISKSYREVTALSNISFRVDKGELFGLIGPDGSGKTTLIRILSTLLLPDKGTAMINGYDTVKDYKKIRNITGYMPGRFSLYPDLSVEENLQFYAAVFGADINKNYYLIESIYNRLEPFKKRPAGKLSGGMKQKLALSCAMIHKPEILLLDEPTTGVDAVSRKEFWQTLTELKKENITIIVSTPYMDEAALCDRVALIQKGKILDIDKPKLLALKFGKKLYAVSGDNMYRLIQDIRIFSEVESAYIFGRHIHVTARNELDFEEKMMSYLVQKKHNQIEITQIESGIEDYFIELMSVQNKQNIEYND